MLKKRNRLSKRSEFLKLKKEGTVWQSPFFGFLFAKESKGNEAKIGFIVSKKISKRAVDRNKIRRTMSELVRHEIKNKEGLKGVFLAKQSILKAKRIDLEKEVKRILNNA